MVSEVEALIVEPEFEYLIGQIGRDSFACLLGELPRGQEAAVINTLFGLQGYFTKSIFTALHFIQTTERAMPILNRLRAPHVQNEDAEEIQFLHSASHAHRLSHNHIRQFQHVVQYLLQDKVPPAVLAEVVKFPVIRVISRTLETYWHNALEGAIAEAYWDECKKLLRRTKEEESDREVSTILRQAEEHLLLLEQDKTLSVKDRYRIVYLILDNLKADVANSGNILFRLGRRIIGRQKERVVVKIQELFQPILDLLTSELEVSEQLQVDFARLATSPILAHYNAIHEKWLASQEHYPRPSCPGLGVTEQHGFSAHESELSRDPLERYIQWFRRQSPQHEFAYRLCVEDEAILASPLIARSDKPEDGSIVIPLGEKASQPALLELDGELAVIDGGSRACYLLTNLAACIEANNRDPISRAPLIDERGRQLFTIVDKSYFNVEAVELALKLRFLVDLKECEDGPNLTKWYKFGIAQLLSLHEKLYAKEQLLSVMMLWEPDELNDELIDTLNRTATKSQARLVPEEAIMRLACIRKPEMMSWIPVRFHHRQLLPWFLNLHRKYKDNRDRRGFALLLNNIQEQELTPDMRRALNRLATHLNEMYLNLFLKNFLRLRTPGGQHFIKFINALTAEGCDYFFAKLQNYLTMWRQIDDFEALYLNLYAPIIEIRESKQFKGKLDTRLEDIETLHAHAQGRRQHYTEKRLVFYREAKLRKHRVREQELQTRLAVMRAVRDPAGRIELGRPRAAV